MVASFFNDHAVLFALLCGVAAVLYGIGLTYWVLTRPAGSEKMQEIARAVQEGAAAYLNRQFRTLGVFVVVVFILLFALPADDVGERVGRSIFFVIGAAFSATIATIPIVMYWRFRYAAAPSWTARAISCIFSDPAGRVSTQ